MDIFAPFANTLMLVLRIVVALVIVIVALIVAIIIYHYRRRALFLDHSQKHNQAFCDDLSDDCDTMQANTYNTATCYDMMHKNNVHCDLKILRTQFNKHAYYYLKSLNLGVDDFKIVMEKLQYHATDTIDPFFGQQNYDYYDLGNEDFYTKTEAY